jgi:uncharacterized protein YacL
MTKSLKRRFIVLIVFIVFGLVHFLATKNVWVLAVAGVFAAITALLEWVFYSKRGVFLFALIGLIAGYFAGTFVYDIFKAILFDNIKLNINCDCFKPYFELAFAYLGFYLTFMTAGRSAFALNMPSGGDAEKKSVETKILDTSVIIDGRISDIAETGFMSGTLIVPKFVLNEIQALADSQDGIRRSRARRGLDVLNHLKEIHNVDMKISARDFPEAKGVDAKLIMLAKEMNASVVTNDYNLNKVAKLEGVTILNMNDLANAMKPILLPGEEFGWTLLKKAKKQPGRGIPRRRHYGGRRPGTSPDRQTHKRKSNEHTPDIRRQNHFHRAEEVACSGSEWDTTCTGWNPAGSLS